MNIGQMRELVAVEKEGEGEDDGYGGWIPGPWVGPTMWARIQSLRGSETVIAARLTGVQPVVIHVRWTPEIADMTPAWRVRHIDKGHVYDIKAVANMDERLEFMEILAQRTA